jgi:hypothetical protein
MIFFALALPLAAQEEESYIDAYNICNGTWMLRLDVNWSATRIEDGLTKFIPDNAVVFDCSRKLGGLYEYMNNTKAVVRCSNSSEQEGESYVEEVQIVCE